MQLRSVVSCLVLAGCGGDPEPTGDDPDAAPAAACVGTWSRQPTVTDLPLHGVWTSTDGDVWTVGGNDLSVAFVVNGRDAYADLVACCSGGDPLIGVWGSAPTRVWGIGNNTYRGSVLHFDGTSLRYSDNLGLGAPDWHFRAIWGADAGTVFVVGTGGGIARRDSGGTWSRMASGVTSELLDVWGTAPNAVWAVGVGGTILFWDGVTWERQASGVGADLHGVGGTARDDVWAVGTRGTALHWDGTRWSETDAATSRTLRDVAGLIASCAWAVGDDGQTLHWDGAWRAIANPISGTTTALRRLWSTNDEVWAVGDAGTTLRWTASR